MDGSPRGEPFQAGSYLTSLAFNGAGDVIATADVGGRLRLWKVDGTPKGEVFGGIGVTENLQGSSLHVVSLVDHAPAAKAGIKPGDLIVKIDDTPTQGMSLNDAKSRLRASPVPCFGTI